MAVVRKKSGSPIITANKLNGRTLNGGDSSLNIFYDFFEQTIDTSLGDGTDTYTFPCQNALTGYSPSVDVSWGDGSFQTATGSGVTHTYSAGGTYNVRAIGTWRLSHLTSADGQKVTDILRFGELGGSGCVNMGANAFYDHENLASPISASDKIPVDNIKDCSNAFAFISVAKDISWFTSWTFPTSVVNWSFAFYASQVGLTAGFTINANIFRMAAAARNWNPDTTNWTTTATTSLRDSFINAQEFTGIGAADWDVSNIGDFYLTFQNTAFNQDVSGWDLSSATTLQGTFGNIQEFNNGDIPATSPASPGTSMLNFTIGSGVTTMRAIFSGCSGFNQDLTRTAGGGWDFPAGMTNMNGLFSGCTNFNGDISNWNVGNVTDMGSMFVNTNNMESDLSSWDVSSVQNMAGMFRLRNNSTDIGLSSWTTTALQNLSNWNRDSTGGAGFNPDISGWDVSNVTTIYGMFYQNRIFTTDLSGWNTSSLETATQAFQICQTLDFSLASWNLSSMVNMSNIMRGTAMTDANVSATLIGWDVATTATGVNATGWCAGNVNPRDMSQTTYASAKTAFDNLTASVGSGGKGWDMTGAINWTA